MHKRPPQRNGRKDIKMNNKNEMQDFALRITNSMLYDELHRYAREYSLPVERLTELAVKRLVEDIELFRSLRTAHLSSK